MNDSSFSSQALAADLLANLESLGYHDMTPIQALSLPPLLAGHDLIGQAKTGSGKTAAFALTLLSRLKVKQFRIQSLVLCPTRELADQVAVEIRKIGRTVHNIKVLTLCGGAPFGPQKGSLEHGAHIIVGTPGRVEDHLRKNNLDLSHVTTFVLDEADRMLDMGFHDVISKIASHLPESRQNLLFSATFPANIKTLAARVMNNPHHVVDDSAHDAGTLEQRLCRINNKRDRTEALVWLLQSHAPVSTLVFCNTRQQTQEVATQLNQLGFSAAAIHGDLEQRDREHRLAKFSNRSLSILVATDVAARGLDIDGLDLVVNYELARDSEVHVHRVGRTGRAGNSGIACTLFHDSETYKVEKLESVAGQSFEKIDAGRAIADYRPEPPPYVTLQIDGGKKQKLRPGDILGALTVKDGINGSAVGKIKVLDNNAIIAIESSAWKQASTLLNSGKIKGRSFRARKL